MSIEQKQKWLRPAQRKQTRIGGGGGATLIETEGRHLNSAGYAQIANFL